ncbi:MAG: RNA polymerase factor sigma-54 [Phenylobacterium sp.]
MALGARLEVRQGQGLVITPQLQQAIKLLQLSNLELEAFLEAELERNPLLSREEAEGDMEAAEAGPRYDEILAADEIPDSGAGPELDVSRDSEASPGEKATGDLAEDADAGGAVDWSRTRSEGQSPDTGEDVSERLVSARTLKEHLAEQLLMSSLEGSRYAVAQVLIDAVDDDGYFRSDMAETADRLACGVPFLEGVLETLQGFEPTGVFARDLRECLFLQLRERDRCDPAMLALLDHLDLLARRDLAALKRVCGVDGEDLMEMISEIRALTPRPGAAFGGEPTVPVVPDVVVRQGPEGLWNVEMNSDTLPRLLVDRRYFARVSAGARTDLEKAFVADCHSKANWLLRCLDQRARTILKVASEIVRQQDAFLAFGVSHLRPLNLRTVADAIGMHESTVSRVTSNKYMATPRGVFELKFFFTAAIPSMDGGEAHSAESVRDRIRRLIETERCGEGVHSDDRIVEILRTSGVDIARRTVAKYRESMRIPSSAERRRRLMVAS